MARVRLPRAYTHRRHIVLSCARRFTLFFFFNDTATTEIYTLSLHDALPISFGLKQLRDRSQVGVMSGSRFGLWTDRKSTRLNSSHVRISYAVFCLKKKKEAIIQRGKVRAEASQRQNCMTSTR